MAAAEEAEYGPDGMPVGLKERNSRVLYGPDGMPLEAGAAVGDDGAPKVEENHIHHGLEIHDQGWFQAESNRLEQEQLAQIHLAAICRAVDERHMAGLCPGGRWVNDPEEFPDLRLRGTVTSNAVVPFPPHDQQFFVCGAHDPETSELRKTAVPIHVPDEDGNSSWVRLIDFADHADAAHLFDEFSQNKTHYGRVYQGALDNGYLVEALQAISLRPKLARQLFHCWDARRSVYIARLYKHGTWMRVELDDFVPVGPPSKEGGNVPICCRSELFPHVLWPSLVEKAYAKVHTLRGSTTVATEDDHGGWEAIGGGGRVEEALADLTGGVAGRWSTSDVSMDRLFVYIYELQRDTLFVCRPHQVNCELHGIRLNSYYPNVVNRAVAWEGNLYFQIFCGAPGVFDGGLQDIEVPYTLIHAPEFPERTDEGFFWMTALDFHEYFETIFECRLTNSGDVSICNMPPPRMPPAMPSTPRSMPAAGGPMMEGSSLPWFEWVYANPGEITRHNEPEFSIRVPERDVPCEICISVEQLDSRMLMRTPQRPRPVALLLKAYESMDGGSDGMRGGTLYSSRLVCRSNWMRARDSMLAFTVNSGCEVKVVAEVPTLDTQIDRLIFRCYASRPSVTVTASASRGRHRLADPVEAPKAQRLSLCGTGRVHKRGPNETFTPIDEELDAMRKPEHDLSIGWRELRSEMKDCTQM